MADQSNVYVGVAGYFGKPDHTGKTGVFVRKTSGGDWKHALGGLEAYTVFVDPNNPDTVFAGTNDGVWRSTDRGATFDRTGFPDARKQVWCFMVDSRDPKKMLAGASPIDVYRSKDGGSTWRKLPTPQMPAHCKGPFASRVMRFAQNPRNPDEIFAALEINGVMHSSDGGETWTDCSEGLIKLAERPHLKSKIVSDTHAEGMLDGHAVTINPADPDSAIVALRMGLFRTTDKGRTWQDMEMKRFSPITYGRDVKASPSEPNTLYCALSVAAASKDGAIYKSRDGGESWKRFDKVQVHGTIMSIGLHQRDPKQVFIGARYDGEVFGTTDGGNTWQAMPLPGEVQHIYSVACG
jgi:photosystem II stability/assembly factor-like uncharacterized protein